jgi:hypothetical protein
MKKLFGKSLFEKKEVKIERMYDFAQHGVLNNPEFSEFNANTYITWGTSLTASIGGTGGMVMPQGVKKEDIKKPKSKKDITPKELHQLGVLNQLDMAINCDEDYIKENVKTLKSKLNLIHGKEGAAKYGRQELESLIERIENRRRYVEFEDRIAEYPHTSSEAIGGILKKEEHLRCKLADEFIPDFPKDAIEAMEDYTDLCIELCGKKPVFYVIADKKDFGVIDKKRDPILLAQSPFGFVWQILGAWDEEMIFLGDL